nr:peptidoglycan-binding domain-containing protein [Sinorhizobium meliloti]
MGHAWPTGSGFEDAVTDIGGAPSKQAPARECWRQRDTSRARLPGLRQGSGRVQHRSLGGPGASVLLGHPGSEPLGRRGRRRDDHEEDHGGKNGLSDHFDRLARISLVPFGYRADNVRQFQADQRLQVDGDVGPKMRAAMHTALVALTSGEAARRNRGHGPVIERWRRATRQLCHRRFPVRRSR